MNNTLKKSDFVLLPYMKSNNFRATYQVLNTLIPYFLLWFLAAKASAISIFLLPPIIVLIVLFFLRIFSLMHDCGHYSLFTSKAANRIVGFMFGVLTAMPQYWWSRDHAYHHKTNGDWERYRGIGDFLSLNEYDDLSTFDKKVYDFTRHPRMVLPGGFFYLAFKPRLVLLLGMVDFVGDVFRSFKQNPAIKFSEAIANHRPKHWGSTAEFWDLLLNSLCVVGGWILCCQTLGTAFFLGTYSVVLALSAASLIAVFFVQHNFDGAYAHKTADWDYLLGAVEGSSYLDIPPILKWFTADISYHNIHHLSEKIPNYNLRACHEKNAHLLGRVTKVRLGDIMRCSEFVLWDAQSASLVSIKDYSS